MTTPSETICGRWLSSTTISLNIWLMMDQSFGVSEDLLTWLKANTPGWRFEDDSDWEPSVCRRLTFARPEDAVLFRLFWEDENRAPKWFLERTF